MPERKIEVRIVGTNAAGPAFDKLNKDLEQSHGLAGRVTGAFGGLTNVLGGIGLAALGVGALATTFGGAVSGLLSDAIEAQGIASATDAVLASTRGAAGMSAKAVADLATELSKVAPFEDEAIQGAENLLLTFTNIGKDIFPGATEAVLNMSQALGQDLKSSSIQLGKALQSPVEGVTALRRVGVMLTDSQEALIKKMVESGDVMGAQKVILGELQTEFGGAARAAGQTFAGKLTILQTQLGNVKEAIGGPLIGILSTLMEKLSPLIAAFGEWLPGAMKSAGDMIGRLWAFVSPVVEELGFWAKALWAVIQGQESLGAVIGPVGDIIEDVLEAVGNLIGVFTGAEGAGLRFHNELEKLIGLDAANFIIGIVKAIQDFTREGGGLEQIMATLKKTLQDIGDVIQDVTKFFEDNKWAQVGLVFVLGLVAAAWAAVKIAALAHNAILAIQTGITWAATAAQTALNLAMTLNPIGIIVVALAALALALVYAWNTSEDFRNIVLGVWDTIKGAVDAAIKAVTGFIDGLGPTFTNMQKTITGVGDAISGAITGTWNGIMATIKNVQDTIRSTIQGVWDAIPADIRADLELIAGVLSERFNKFVSDITGWMAGIWATISTTWENIKTTIDSILTSIRDNVIQPALDAITGVLDTAWTTITGAVTRAWEDFKNAITGKLTGESGALSVVNGFVADVIAKLGTLATDALGKAQEIGGAIIDGIKAGINAGWQALSDLVGNLARGLLDAAKRALGITGSAAPSVQASPNINPENLFGGMAYGGGGIISTGGTAISAGRNSVAGITIQQNFYGPADGPTVKRASEAGVMAAARSMGIA